MDNDTIIRYLKKKSTETDDQDTKRGIDAVIKSIEYEPEDLPSFMRKPKSGFKEASKKMTDIENSLKESSKND